MGVIYLDSGNVGNIIKLSLMLPICKGKLNANWNGNSIQVLYVFGFIAYTKLNMESNLFKSLHLFKLSFWMYIQ